MVTLHLSRARYSYAVADEHGNIYRARNCDEHGPDCYTVALDANPSTATVRVPDAGPAADASGGEHDLADR